MSLSLSDVLLMIMLELRDWGKTPMEGRVHFRHVLSRVHAFSIIVDANNLAEIMLVGSSRQKIRHLPLPRPPSLGGSCCASDS